MVTVAEQAFKSITDGCSVLFLNNSILEASFLMVGRIYFEIISILEASSLMMPRSLHCFYGESRFAPLFLSRMSLRSIVASADS